MTKLGTTALAVFGTLMVAASSFAQMKIGSMPRHFLLLNPKVQVELKITAAQKSALEKAAGDAVSTDDQGRTRVQIGPGTDLDEIKKDMAKVITPAQDARLKQIWIQRDGAFALGDADIAKELGLDAGQKAKVTAEMEAYGDDMQDLVGSSGGHISAEMAKPIREKAKKRLDAILTAAQRAKFDGMKGSPFKI